MNIETINSILLMLNLKLDRTAKDDYELTNYNTDTVKKLKYNNHSYEYDFLKDETPYHLVIKDSTIILTNDLRETFIFKPNRFEYYQRKEKKEENKARVVVANSELSFYLASDTHSEHYSLKTSTNLEMISNALNKIFEDFGIQGTLRKNTSISYDEDNIPMRTETHIRYNKDGKLINKEFFPTIIEQDFYDYIIDDISNHKFMIELIDHLESVLPGITEQLIIINKNFKQIIERMKQKTLKQKNT